MISNLSPSLQGRDSLKNEPEITSAVSVCLVKSGIRIAQSIQFSLSEKILPVNAVAPPKDLPSLSKPLILKGICFNETSPSSRPDKINPNFGNRIG